MNSNAVSIDINCGGLSFKKCTQNVNFHCNSRVPFIRDGLTGTIQKNKDNLSLAKPLENLKILEIGCGAGILTEVGYTQA